MGDQPCVPVGACPDSQACIPSLGINCSSGSCGFSGLCDSGYECELEFYAEPEVAISRLPESAPDLLNNLSDQQPQGATPTVPALSGVTDFATDWLVDNPEHEVIVVLATDGEPTDCGGPAPPTQLLIDVAAASHAEGVRTFVIGVFSSDQAADAKVALDQIAAAGGSDEAFVITTAEEVSEAFLAALNEVRLDAKACEFGVQIPEPIDFDAVGVKIESDVGAPVWVPRVAGPSDCDGGGYFYDREPKASDAFLNVVLCPDTCTLLGASPDRRAEIYTACPDPTQ